MGMLERIKKRHYDGFKEFVMNMETTGGSGRQQIFLTGILEDPVFMSHVMKNIHSFDDFLSLPSDEIDCVLKLQEQMPSVLAKCVFGMDDKKMKEFEALIPKHVSKLRDELSVLSAVSAHEKEGAKYFILKTVRKMQNEDLIAGFGWKLPPQDLFFPKIYQDGENRIFFESGILAAEGSFFRGKRTNTWKHYYDTGKIFAEGEYDEGLKVGEWTYFFGNGELKSKGKYLADLKQGAWKEWDRVGNVSSVEYKDGSKRS
jgi:hypothetical protein